uniref:Uncharacterized protein n=1 Tax=Avena sativa TaxID=4498 RepID=A0ACD5YJH0_AVESA
MYGFYRSEEWREGCSGEGGKRKTAGRMAATRLLSLTSRSTRAIHLAGGDVLTPLPLCSIPAPVPRPLLSPCTHRLRRHHLPSRRRCTCSNRRRPLGSPPRSPLPRAAPRALYPSSSASASAPPPHPRFLLAGPRRPLLRPPTSFLSAGATRPRCRLAPPQLPRPPPRAKSTKISPIHPASAAMAVPSPFLAPHPVRPDPAVPTDASADCPPSLDFGDPASLATLRGLTDAGAATRLLHECVAYQRSLDARLDGLLARRPDLDRAAASLLRSAPPLLSLAASDASALKDSSSSTAALADALSSRVRHLDAAHSRAESALARAEAALDRSRALDAARRALAADDLTAAASAAHEFLAIDSRFPTDDDLRRDLLDIKRRVEGLARRRLSAAVDAQDHPAVLRLVRLFPLLGLADEGLQVYVAYLKNVVALRARADFEHLAELISATTQPTPERPDFVGCLTRLFKDIVLAVEENDAVLRELRGEDAVAYAIIELQEECDSRGTQILRRYADYRKLARLSSDINSYTRNLLSVVGSVANAAGGNEGPDPREVEHYLEEILALTQLGEDYTEFMVNKIRGLRDVKPELGPQAMKAFRNGSFSKMEKDLTGFYVILEEFFMVENIRKAIQIDEPVPDGLTTSMVDDVFFLLQSCCRRAASTASINSLLAVLGGATSLLSNEYQEALQWRMREPNLGAKLFLGGVGVHKTGEEIAAALNNMDVSSEYVLKLRHEIEELCQEVSSFLSPSICQVTMYSH